MNLFELFVKVGVDDQASGKLGEITGKLGNGLKTAAKIGTAAVGVAATGITALTTAAVKNYAEYEQLVGGVETLFKDSADVVGKYAANAYKTAGLSANEYMSTVTSFSASLLQSLGGDTEEAAKYADVAVTDMADNANKMGTSMEMLQTTYAGFAKQNFTMLDNLKLGYGGTKEEMQRLLDDASKISGIKYDISSFADITQAIHIMQEEMGIAGATALEAGTTIEGSVNSMKGAWQNLITGLADGNADIELLINNLVTTIVGDGTETNLGVIGNVLPAIETALGGAVKLIEGVFPKIIEMLPNLFTTLLPSIVTGALNIVQSLVDSLSANSNLLMSSAVDMIMTLVNGLLGMLPDIIKLGLDLIVSLALGIADALPELIPTIVDVIMQIVTTLTDPEVLGNLIDAAIAIIMGLADGLIEALPVLIEAIPTIINNLIDAIIENLPKIIAMGYELTLKLTWGIIKAIPDLVRAIPELFTALVKAIVGQYVVLFNTGKEIIGKLLEGIKNAWEDVKSWFSNAWDNLFGGRKVEIDAEVNEETDGSHRGGLRYVPYDGYVAELHKGERVLTAEESRAYNEGRNISVVQNIYSSAKTAADLMREAKWEQDRAVFGLV